MSKWVRVGKAKEAHGLKGELYILLFAKESPWLREMREFALAADDAGPFQVFKVEKAKAIKGGLIVKPEGLADRTQAEAKLGLLFYLSDSMTLSAPDDRIVLGEIRGFIVRTEKEIVGPIQDFSSNGPQDLLVVQRGSTTVEIPFIEPFIKRLDFEARELWMDLPEGLWDE